MEPSDILHGIDGKLWIITHRVTTNNPLKIPILSKALELINKYKKHSKSLAKATVSPKISNQKRNSYLKKIGDLSERHKTLTFHLARHTFSMTITLTNGVPMETVSKLLGHSRLSTTQIYAKVIESKANDDMLQLKEKLKNASISKVKKAN
ncbi:site-specific integrase [Sediminibacter sp. Hel_I_10]|uniref:site-specific integrase n=1 Tax=Sediminibacter sp. Hel_I_10 TaxID=1392490 RepID=UPI0018CC1BBC|nr:site-specific integrase [Sediminibacter sp. Hel_I_10]